jgi:hypothetical protein
MDEQNANLVTRPIHRPFFLVNTPDKIGNYLSANYYNVVMGRFSGLSAFLAPAKLVEEVAGTRKTQTVTYDLGKYQQDLAQMEYLPAAVVAAFEKAAKAFCGQAGITEFEKNLRQNFALPDPDLDPQAYRVYGPPNDRRLVILWGTEIRAGSSLRLLPDPSREGQSIVEKLQGRIMTDENKCAEALKVLDLSTHPLARFVATEIRANGKLRELLSCGKRIPADKVRRMKYVPKAELAEFEKAAIAYYNEAHADYVPENPDEKLPSDYEKELRKALRLPSVKADKGSHYYTCAGKLLITPAAPGFYASSLHLVSDGVLGIPAPYAGPQGRMVTDATVHEELSERLFPLKKAIAAGSVAAVVLVGAIIAGTILLDKTPPSLVGQGERGKDYAITTRETGPGMHEDTPGRIRFVWSENIDAASAKAPQSVFLSDSFNSPVELKPENIQVTGNILDINLPEGSRMEYGQKYKVTFRNITDTSIRHNPIRSGDPDMTQTFVFADTVGPKVTAISAEGSDSHKILVRFSEAIDVSTAETARNYEVDGFRVNAASYLPNDHSVILTCERDDPDARRNNRDGFSHKEPFTVRLSSARGGICDVSGNELVEPLLFDSLSFVDTVPPRILNATSTSQLQISLEMAEPVLEAGVKATSFSVEPVKDAPPVTVRFAELMPDGRTIKISTTPMQAQGRYRVSASGLTDVQNNTIPSDSPQSVEFSCNCVEDRTPPTLQKASEGAGNDSVNLTFSEAVMADSLVSSAVSVTTDAVASRTIAVTRLEASGADGRSFIAFLEAKLNPGERVVVTVGGAKDLLGNVQEKTTLAFSTRGAQRALFKDLLPADDDSARITGANTVKLTFYGELDPATAQNPAHYRVDGQNIVTGAKLEDPKERDGVTTQSVILQLSAPARAGQVVEARELNILDQATRKPKGPQQTVKFTVGR